jgi:hypothetical protein
MQVLYKKVKEGEKMEEATATESRSSRRLILGRYQDYYSSGESRRRQTDTSGAKERWTTKAMG